MTIDLKTVKHISKLARISLDDEKANKLANDLNSIFEFIEKLVLELDVKGVPQVDMSFFVLRNAKPEDAIVHLEDFFTELKELNSILNNIFDTEVDDTNKEEEKKEK